MAFAPLRERRAGVDVRELEGGCAAPEEQHSHDHPGKGVGVTDVIPQGILVMREDDLVESWGIPSGIFGLHKQKVPPTRDAYLIISVRRPPSYPHSDGRKSFIGLSYKLLI